jgi:hypothetical protein
MNAPANAKRQHNLILLQTTTPSRLFDVQHQENEGNHGQERLLFRQAVTSGVYYPETLKSMRLAFDLAWNHVSSLFEDPETSRQILAAQILHHADRGKHKVSGLATAAADDLLALTGVCDRHHASTGGPRAKGNVNRDFAHFRARDAGSRAHSELMCGKSGQAVLAGTAIAPRDDLEYVKIACVREHLTPTTESR